MIERLYTPLKLVHHHERLEELRIHGFTQTPVDVQFDLTGRCNYDCPWCYFVHGVRYDNGEGVRDPSQDLETEWVLTIFQELQEMGVQGIEITGGGEPLLHRQAPTIFADAVSRFHVGTITNGSLLGRLPDDTLRRVTWVRVSLNSGSEDCFRAIHHIQSAKTAREYRRRVLENLQRAAALHGPEVTVQYCVSSQNWWPEELRQCVEICRDLGVQQVRFSTVTTKETNLILTAEQRAQVDETLTLLGAEYPGHSTFSVLNLFTERNRSEIQGPHRHERCLFQNFVGVIGADYILYACCHTKYMHRFAIGDLRTTSFRELWTGDRVGFIARLSPKTACPPCWMRPKNDLLEYILTDDPQTSFP